MSPLGKESLFTHQKNTAIEVARARNMERRNMERRNMERRNMERRICTST
jgi:hypothetical protein